LLTSGIPFGNNIQHNQFQYYVVYPSNTYHNIQINIDCFYGSVDMYISKDWDSRPRYNNILEKVDSYILKSTNNNNLYISHDQLYEICDGYYTLQENKHCYLIIGVFGSYSDIDVTSSYQISAVLNDITVLLSSNVIKTSHISSGDNDIYKYIYDISSKKDIIVSVTPLFGDPDVFIDVSPNYHPSIWNFTWMSVSYNVIIL
jgi:hypothetical protein